MQYVILCSSKMCFKELLVAIKNTRETSKKETDPNQLTCLGRLIAQI